MLYESKDLKLTTNAQTPAADWRYVSEYWIDIMADSESNRIPGGDRPASSASSCEEGGERPRRILVVEDNRADVYLIREALLVAALRVELRVLEDGEKAVQFIEELDMDESAVCPDLVIIDINLPKKSGGEVLDRWRRSRRCGNQLALVVTSSDSDRDRDAMNKLGANGYFRKPSTYADFMKLGELVKTLLTPAAGSSTQ